VGRKDRGKEGKKKERNEEEVEVNRNEGQK
jgi:hypothetical protein